MLRKKVFAMAGLNYDPEFLSSEDYDLWARAAKVVSLANVPRVLLRYRLQPPSANKSVIKEAYADRVRHRLLEDLGLDPSYDDLALHGFVGRCEIGPDPEWLRRSEKWLTRIDRANKAATIYDEGALSAFLADRFWRLCWNARTFGPEVWRIFRESDWRSLAHVSAGMQARLWWQSRACKTGAVN
jgi:hypothetical protein